jgi:hypothetical protein
VSTIHYTPTPSVAQALRTLRTMELVCWLLATVKAGELGAALALALLGH